jgi:hypothetical protein
MINSARKFAPPPETPTVRVEDPRRTFESAIALMQPSRTLAQTPIGWRRRTTTSGDVAVTEKRAVTDAARALARLWNVAPSMVR